MPRLNSFGAQGYSLPDIHSSVDTSNRKGRWGRLLAFAGPAYLVSVGYMDPGNWATDVEGGSRFGYRLLWVLVLSNLMALLLQTLSSRLGIVTRRDLAQACRDEYSASLSYILWVLCEIAIVACDLAEVLGAAIGLNLLFHLPLIAGVLVTAADTLLVLWFTRKGIRVIEAFVLVLIATIAACFAFEIFFAKPNLPQVLGGLIPRLNLPSLYVAVSILGATVMPHNLYLHSALVQTRQIGETDEDKRRACQFNFLDSAIALNGALFVNAAILVMAGAIFFSRHIVVTEIQQAHQLLTPIMGTTLASVLFGTALLCSGQSSTLTGTMAGQIVMEGFLHFRMQPWLRRAITRCLAIGPAILTIYLWGNAGTYKLIILSQVILSLQLPFAVIPLVQFTNDPKRMGQFANALWVRITAWVCAAFILVLNGWLLWEILSDWLAGMTGFRPVAATISVATAVAFLGLLVTITAWPRLGKRRRAIQNARVALTVEQESAPLYPARSYQKILIPIDHSESDQEALGNALALARVHKSHLILLHVEEGVTSQLFGSQASTAEITEGQNYLAHLSASLREQGIEVEVIVRHGRSPANQIATAVTELSPDLVVMASHGHRGIKDLIFGTTINDVRHKIKAPLLIVSGS